MVCHLTAKYSLRMLLASGAALKAWKSRWFPIQCPLNCILFSRVVLAIPSLGQQVVVNLNSLCQCDCEDSLVRLQHDY